VDIRSDLYSLGVVFWEMITRDAVFKGSPAEVIYQHQHAPLPLEKLEHVPQPVVVLIDVLLEKDPGRRFQTEKSPCVIRTFEMSIRTGMFWTVIGARNPRLINSTRSTSWAMSWK
jgi:serine/threonine protein kinase